MRPTITTLLGAVYKVEAPIGSGGQGIVVRLKSQQGLAAKVLYAGSEREREALRNRIAFVRSLPLQDLPIAMPIDALAPPLVGYTMQLLRDMVPAAVLIRAARGTEVPPSEWYASTGGIARRLRLMAKTCDILSEIHARGLCYGDVSPRNLFVSEKGADAQVWFIDADNLKHESRSSATKIFTPGYGAPEVLSGRCGASTLTDAHSVAVLAFQALTLVHPLVGDAVSDGEPELEERALRGEMPWIEDENDRSNRSGSGVPREWALSPNLRRVFAQYFGPGLKGPLVRPGVASLAQALHAAADFTLRCGGCHQYFYARHRSCPWCEAPRPTFLILKAKRWEPSKGAAIDLAGNQQGRPYSTLPHLAMALRQGLTLTSRILSGTTGIAGNTARAKLSSVDGKKLVLEAFDDLALYVGPPRSEKMRRVTQKSTELPIGAWLHTGPADKPHRVFEILRSSNDA